MCFSLAQLDISSKESVTNFREMIESQHGGVIHSLINNAAIAYKRAATEPFGEQAKVSNEGRIRVAVFKTHFLCTLRLCIVFMCRISCDLHTVYQTMVMKSSSHEIITMKLRIFFIGRLCND